MSEDDMRQLTRDEVEWLVSENGVERWYLDEEGQEDDFELLVQAIQRTIEKAIELSRGGK
jgi:hypothetical protein